MEWVRFVFWSSSDVTRWLCCSIVEIIERYKKEEIVENHTLGKGVLRVGLCPHVTNCAVIVSYQFSWNISLHVFYSMWVKICIMTFHIIYFVLIPQSSSNPSKSLHNFVSLICNNLIIRKLWTWLFCTRVTILDIY